MAGLTVQNFVSAAVGIAVAMALVRGLARRRSHDDRQLLGRPHADDDPDPAAALDRRSRSCSSSQGVVQNLHGAGTRAHRRGRRPRSIPGGPVASQEAIKELGTNGGGSVNANSAHPFENPNAVHELLRDAGAPRDPVRAHLHVRQAGRRPAAGLGVFAAMFVLWLGVALASRCTSRPPATRSSRRARPARPPRRRAATWRARRCASARPTSGLFAASTTGTSTGAVDRAHDSFTPLGGAVPLVNMMLGEVSPGRHRRRALRDAHLRPARGLHRRPDGRPDAGVPRQEDPGGGDEARRRSTSSSCRPLILVFAGDLGACSTRRSRRS